VTVRGGCRRSWMPAGCESRTRECDVRFARGVRCWYRARAAARRRQASRLLAALEIHRPRALTESAKAAARTKGTYLATHHAQLRGRRGEAKAVGATRHDSLVAYFHIVRDQVAFRELGPDWQRKRYSSEHRARRLQRQLGALGYRLVGAILGVGWDSLRAPNGRITG